MSFVHGINTTPLLARRCAGQSALPNGYRCIHPVQCPRFHTSPWAWPRSANDIIPAMWGAFLGFSLLFLALRPSNWFLHYRTWCVWFAFRSNYFTKLLQVLVPSLTWLSLLPLKRHSLGFFPFFFTVKTLRRRCPSQPSHAEPPENRLKLSTYKKQKANGKSISQTPKSSSYVSPNPMYFGTKVFDTLSKTQCILFESRSSKQNL